MDLQPTLSLGDEPSWVKTTVVPTYAVASPLQSEVFPNMAHRGGSKRGKRSSGRFSRPS